MLIAAIYAYSHLSFIMCFTGNQQKNVRSLRLIRRNKAEMLQIAREVHAGVASGMNTGENVRKTMQRKNFRGAEESLQGHLRDLGETEKKAEKMKDEAKKCENIMYDNQKRIDRLEAAIYKMQERMDRLEKKNDYLEHNMEKMKSNLETWQTAHDFENLLATHIYPRGSPVTFGPIFANLMIWLDENKNTPEGQEASTKWNQFKVNWSDKHEKVLYKMLKCRMVIEHSEVDFKSNFSDEDNRYLDEIREMSELLKRSNP